MHRNRSLTQPSCKGSCQRKNVEASVLDQHELQWSVWMQHRPKSLIKTRCYFSSVCVSLQQAVAPPNATRHNHTTIPIVSTCTRTRGKNQVDDKGRYMMKNFKLSCRVLWNRARTLCTKLPGTARGEAALAKSLLLSEEPETNHHLDRESLLDMCVCVCVCAWTTEQ